MDLYDCLDNVCRLLLSLTTSYFLKVLVVSVPVSRMEEMFGTLTNRTIPEVEHLSRGRNLKLKKLVNLFQILRESVTMKMLMYL